MSCIMPGKFKGTLQELRKAQVQIAELEDQVRLARKLAEEEISLVNQKAADQVKQVLDRLNELHEMEDQLNLYNSSIQNLDNTDSVRHFKELNLAVTHLHSAEYRLGPIQGSACPWSGAN